MDRYHGLTVVAVAWAAWLAAMWLLWLMPWQSGPDRFRYGLPGWIEVRPARANARPPLLPFGRQVRGRVRDGEAVVTLMLALSVTGGLGWWVWKDTGLKDAHYWEARRRGECRRCGHPLRGVDGFRCPECGQYL